MQIPYCADIWLGPYIRNRLSRLSTSGSDSAPVRVWVTITDHYEPFWRNRDPSLASERVAEWRRKWPRVADRHHDSRGVPAQYSFFYPEEEYRPELLENIAEMVRAGYGDVEIHLHHDGEGEVDFLERMNRFKQVLFDRHGLLRKVSGQIVFGFIHGNWALANSRPDGRWCGLNNEIRLLRDLGCYADFTMPCGPAPMQTRMINTIYWAVDDPDRPKSYDTGDPLIPGGEKRGDLLMITGPFGLRWRGRWKPRLEIGELAGYDPPTAYRVSRWLDLAPRVGRDIFIKLFGHGAQEKNMRCMLDGGLDLLFGEMARQCGIRGYQLCYVSAWQMYQAVCAAAELKTREAA
jgi:hypothetical protein